jgi:hypothetical protein
VKNRRWSRNKNRIVKKRRRPLSTERRAPESAFPWPELHAECAGCLCSLSNEPACTNECIVAVCCAVRIGAECFAVNGTIKRLSRADSVLLNFCLARRSVYLSIVWNNCAHLPCVASCRIVRFDLSRQPFRRNDEIALFGARRTESNFWRQFKFRVDINTDGL